MSTIYTIGFTEKSADRFFSLVRSSTAKCLVDIRLNNQSQLAGFTKKDDLSYFLKEILRWSYQHRPELAPNKEMMDKYKKFKGSWSEYETDFLKLLDLRQIGKTFSAIDFIDCVFLCSEDKPDYCHRRLVAEYLTSRCSQVILIKHL